MTEENGLLKEIEETKRRLKEIAESMTDQEKEGVSVLEECEKGVADWILNMDKSGTLGDFSAYFESRIMFTSITGLQKGVEEAKVIAMYLAAMRRAGFRLMITKIEEK